MSVSRDQLSHELTIHHELVDPAQPYMTKQLVDYKGQPFLESILNFPNVPYSMEFASFIQGWNRGFNRDNNPHTERCYLVATSRNKNFYGQPIIDNMGSFTEVGKEIARDIVSMYQLIIDTYRETGQKLIKYEEITYENVNEHIHTFEDIILTGTLSGQEQRYLHVLYVRHLQDLLHNARTGLLNPNTTEDEHDAFTRLERQTQLSLNATFTPFDKTDTRFEFYQYSPQLQPQDQEKPTEAPMSHLNLAAFRHRPMERRAFDHLIMYGLVDKVGIARSVFGLGKAGRPLATVRISPIGVRFSELMLEHFGDKFRRMSGIETESPKIVPLVISPIQRSKILAEVPQPVSVTQIGHPTPTTPKRHEPEELSEAERIRIQRLRDEQTELANHMNMLIAQAKQRQEQLQEAALTPEPPVDSFFNPAEFGKEVVARDTGRTYRVDDFTPLSQRLRAAVRPSVPLSSSDTDQDGVATPESDVVQDQLPSQDQSNQGPRCAGVPTQDPLEGFETAQTEDQ